MCLRALVTQGEDGKSEQLGFAFLGLLLGQSMLED
jgi:hypothetical protein